MTLLLKSATILDASQPSQHGKKRDILIENGVITKIATRLETPKGAKTISLKNLHVSPGWFDSSVSFGEPGFEERETLSNGLRVAAASGFTGIVLNTDTRPVPDTSGDIVFLKDSSSRAITELFPLGTLSKGAGGTELAELYDMSQAGAIGFSDYKAALEQPNLLKLALLYTRNFNGLVFSFPQDEDLSAKGQMNEGEVSVRLGLKGIPSLAEELRIARDLAILEYTGGKLHIPLISTERSVELIAGAKKRGLDVSCSVSVHHLFLTDSELESFDSRFKVLPPLRGRRDCKALQKALKEGIIDLVTSDHCPVDVEEKRVEFDRAAYGTIGLESAFGVLNQIYDTATCTGILARGRSRFGLPEIRLRTGETANLTLFDPEASYTFEAGDIQSTSKNAIFLGKPLKGRTYGVIVGGKSNLG